MNAIISLPPGQTIPFVFAHDGRGVEIRAVDWRDAPAFVAKDVAEALGYVWKGTTGTMSHVPEEWRGVCSVQTPSGKQDMAVLSEPGLYFFLSRSDKPAALPMQKWVAGEVLPSIRRTGGYILTTPDETPEDIMARAVLVAQDTIARQQARVAQLQATVEAQAPAVLAIEQLEASVGAMCLTDAAKTLGRPPREFSRALERASWVYRRDGTGELVAYQAKIKSGLLEHATFKFWTPAGERRVRSQVKVTPAGLAKLARMFGAE